MSASLRFLCAAGLLGLCGTASLILGRWNGPLPPVLYFLPAMVCLAFAALLGGGIARRILIGAVPVAVLILAYLAWNRPETCLEAQLRDPATRCIYAVNLS
jgi:hypothetical protein